jgi:hypothetical protein
MVDTSHEMVLQRAGKQELERIAEADSVSADSEDVLDWDVWLEAPPPRPGGTLSVRLEFAGREKLAPVDDP